ncbi:hypothetical protein BDB00DRAFT_784647 [Zychaea mexicana]|uniref:uncharacterized protein n=1 Tax=Zychaea mexicana TaxID=64656 RepID=UPI0022FDEEA3|nr:uncharacterized protein BDB00DRAFT_784647 [Zychaea mexicana]KAI9497729.1 hypothetical protein BDB00DRAFT_784647 [Zychaea mexicana]
MHLLKSILPVAASAMQSVFRWFAGFLSSPSNSSTDSSSSIGTTKDDDHNQDAFELATDDLALDLSAAVSVVQAAASLDYQAHELESKGNRDSPEDDEDEGYLFSKQQYGDEDEEDSDDDQIMIVSDSEEEGDEDTPSIIMVTDHEEEEQRFTARNSYVTANETPFAKHVDTKRIDIVNELPLEWHLTKLQEEYGLAPGAIHLDGEVEKHSIHFPLESNSLYSKEGSRMPSYILPSLQTSWYTCQEACERLISAVESAARQFEAALDKRLFVGRLNSLYNCNRHFIPYLSLYILYGGGGVIFASCGSKGGLWRPDLKKDLR